MPQNTICPECKRAFKTASHLKTGINDLNSLIRLILHSRFRSPFSSTRDALDEAIVAVCPYCGNEFSAQSYKFFGVLSLRALRVVMIILMVFFIAIPIYILLRDTVF